MNHDFKVGGFITKAFGLVNGMLPSAFFFSPENDSRLDVGRLRFRMMKVQCSSCTNT